MLFVFAASQQTAACCGAGAAPAAALRGVLNRQDEVLGPWAPGKDPLEDALAAFAGARRLPWQLPLMPESQGSVPGYCGRPRGQGPSMTLATAVTDQVSGRCSCARSSHARDGGRWACCHSRFKEQRPVGPPKTGHLKAGLPIACYLACYSVAWPPGAFRDLSGLAFRPVSRWHMTCHNMHSAATVLLSLIDALECQDMPDEQSKKCSSRAATCAAQARPAARCSTPGRPGCPLRRATWAARPQVALIPPMWFNFGHC